MGLVALFDWNVAGGKYIDLDGLAVFEHLEVVTDQAAYEVTLLIRDETSTSTSSTST